jgi:hypothetical protein
MHGRIKYETCCREFLSRSQQSIVHRSVPQGDGLRSGSGGKKGARSHLFSTVYM